MEEYPSPVIPSQLIHLDWESVGRRLLTLKNLNFLTCASRTRTFWSLYYGIGIFIVLFLPISLLSSSRAHCCYLMSLCSGSATVVYCLVSGLVDFPTSIVFLCHFFIQVIIFLTIHKR